MSAIRIGIVGLGTNTREKHVPGFRACAGVSIDAVCNRSSASTSKAADEFGIAKTYNDWRDLVEDPDIDAVVIGTWPYLHCEITLAALAAGKHVLTEARMAMNADEAKKMLSAARQHPDLVTQVVPSPFGLKAHLEVKNRIADGFLGELREVLVIGTQWDYANAERELRWRQSAERSGMNVLALGILHETLIRWVPDPICVEARAKTFTKRRRDEETGEIRSVEIPDSVQVLTELVGGARGIYHMSGVEAYGPEPQIQLFGDMGTIVCRFNPDRLYVGSLSELELAKEMANAQVSKGQRKPRLRAVRLDPRQAVGWQVEQDFVDAIRGYKRIEFTDFETGVRYMEFTEAVARSAAAGIAVRVS